MAGEGPNSFEFFQAATYLDINKVPKVGYQEERKLKIGEVLEFFSLDFAFNG